MIRLDLRYAEKRSFWLDLKIMVMTVPALLAQLRGADRGRGGGTGKNWEIGAGKRVTVEINPPISSP
jgi:hypothetical protein